MFAAAGLLGVLAAVPGEFSVSTQKFWASTLPGTMYTVSIVMATRALPKVYQENGSKRAQDCGIVGWPKIVQTHTNASVLYQPDIVDHSQPT
jgi:hypothetical protein